MHLAPQRCTYIRTTHDVVLRPSLPAYTGNVPITSGTEQNPILPSFSVHHTAMHHRKRHITSTQTPPFAPSKSSNAHILINEDKRYTRPEYMHATYALPAVPSRGIERDFQPYHKILRLSTYQAATGDLKRAF